MKARSATVLTDEFFSTAEHSWSDDGQGWQNARRQLLDAVPAELRVVVERLLSKPRFGGSGIRAWAERIAAGATVLPRRVPADLVRVYLEHSEAMPHHECSGCGMAVPVLPSRHGCDESPAHAFFPTCPSCGEKTGPYLYQACSQRLRAKPR